MWLLVGLAVMTVSATSRPKVVLQMFAEKYLLADKAEWVEIKNELYQAQFISSNMEMEVVLPERGGAGKSCLKSGNVILEVVMDSTGKVLKQLPRLTEKAKKEDFYD